MHRDSYQPFVGLHPTLANITSHGYFFSSKIFHFQKDVAAFVLRTLG